MNEVNNNQPNENQDDSVTPLSRPGGQKVIQPSESITQELQAQQAQSTQQSTEAITPQLPPSVNQVPQNQQPPVQSNTQNIYPDPSSTQMQVGMSASQMGYNQPKNKLFDLNPKKLAIKGAIGLVVLIVVFAVLVFTNIIALSEFKNVAYTNSKGTNYKLDFYSKHGSKQLKTGNSQLVSKVSKDGKFPIVLSISTTDEMSGYNRAKDCSGFTKVFDVQNTNLNQKISVCDFGKQGNLPAGGVYIAGFMHKNQAHIVTIGQDYGDIDLSSQSGAQQSLTRFGMEPYKSDIERIISSIKVE